MSKKRPHQFVQRVTQSPVNPTRWVLDLLCGHEVWVTSKSRPTRETVRCPKCGVVG